MRAEDRRLEEDVIDRVLADYSRVEPDAAAVGAWVAKARSVPERRTWPGWHWTAAAAACLVVAGGGAGLRMYHARWAMPPAPPVLTARIPPPVLPPPPASAVTDGTLRLAGESTRIVELVTTGEVTAVTVAPDAPAAVAWAPFPAPAPLSPQEKLILQFVRQYPRQWDGVMQPGSDSTPPPGGGH